MKRWIWNVGAVVALTFAGCVAPEDLEGPDESSSSGDFRSAPTSHSSSTGGTSTGTSSSSSTGSTSGSTGSTSTTTSGGDTGGPPPFCGDVMGESCQSGATGTCITEDGLVPGLVQNMCCRCSIGADGQVSYTWQDCIPSGVGFCVPP